MNQALEALKERGFFSQCTDADELSARMDAGPVTFYVGCDPTGPSLHIGHMVPFFALRHLRSFGHHGLALIGGGTGRIGDPSGKTEMRKMLDYDQIDANVEKIKAQLDRFIGFDDKTAFAVNNKDWLVDLNYIDFYQLLQAYDFYMLHQKYSCILQIGGDDQWGNITAGVDLIRRKLGGTTELNKQHESFGLTFPLIMRADGKKMGKSEKGAVFLDPNLTSVFDFFQYWRNVADADVEKFFKLFTFLPLSEISSICAGNINEAKERLAYEVTKVIHGQEEADKALSGARAAFSGAGDKSSMPTVTLARASLDAGIPVCDVFFDAKLCATKSDARRLVQQGGASINGKTINDVKAVIGSSDLDSDGELVVKAGKKKIARVIFN